MNPIKEFFQTNIFISLAAVSLTVETQILLELKPQWQPYLLFIFFAVLFEYNLHRLLSILSNQESKKLEKQLWTGISPKNIYVLLFFSAAGFLWSCFFVKEVVLIVFTLIAMLTLLYSILIFGNKKYLFGLREFPYLKIFLIATVWSTSTVLLPVIESPEKSNNIQVMLMIVERFFFIFAIAIPFDIRDMEADQLTGLKTIPLRLNEKKSLTISYLALLAFFLISFFHYHIRNDLFIISAISISALSTYLALRMEFFKNLSWYYSGILDGSMILQALLVVVSYNFTHN
jgi:4-hydroxybenzoate polyprenyltransferase